MYFAKPEMVPCYLARRLYCITQLLPFSCEYWASESGQRKCFPIEKKSRCVYQRMIIIKITTIIIITTIITNDINYFPE